MSTLILFVSLNLLCWAFIVNGFFFPINCRQVAQLFTILGINRAKGASFQLMAKPLPYNISQKSKMATINGSPFVVM
jgi:hypothetical protein